MNKISAYHHAARLEDQASSLLDKISEFRLANYADQSIDWDRLKRFHSAVFRRYNRRAYARQAAFEAYLNEYETQVIAYAVEREAFPDSGDTFAAPLANAPVLAECRKEQKAGLFVANAGQGSIPLDSVLTVRCCIVLKQCVNLQFLNDFQFIDKSTAKGFFVDHSGKMSTSNKRSWNELLETLSYYGVSFLEQRAEQGSGSFSPCRIAEHRRAFQRRFWWYRDFTLASVTPSRLRGVSILSQVAYSSRCVRHV